MQAAEMAIWQDVFGMLANIDNKKANA